MLLFVICCARRQAVTASRYRDAHELVELSREYGQRAQLSSMAPGSHTAASQLPAEVDNNETEGEYQNVVAAALVQKDFDALEKMARDARERKTRFSGGVWKLYSYYVALSIPILGESASDEDWKFHFANLKAWVEARPESAAARIALASAYEGYGNKARGSGYASSVSDDGWKVYAERYEQAASVLADAAILKEKCPFWYEAMQDLALAQGWEKSQEKQLFAIRNSPG